MYTAKNRNSAMYSVPMGYRNRRFPINPCEIREDFCRKPNALHHPVIYQSVKLLHQTAVFLPVSYVLTQNDEADRVLLRTGITGRNLSGFAARRIFHLQAYQNYRYEKPLHEIMEVKIDEIQSEK